MTAMCKEVQKNEPVSSEIYWRQTDVVKKNTEFKTCVLILFFNKTWVFFGKVTWLHLVSRFSLKC